jgi:hypothetical protein
VDIVSSTLRVLRATRLRPTNRKVLGKIIIIVEEAYATSNSYQVQTGHRHRKREKRMLIGILIRSVTSKSSCALDGSPSGERVKTGDESEGEKHLKL